jgi:hypothetical protein
MCFKDWFDPEKYNQYYPVETKTFVKFMTDNEKDSYGIQKNNLWYITSKLVGSICISKFFYLF